MSSQKISNSSRSAKMWLKFATTKIAGRFDIHHKYLAEDLIGGIDIDKYVFLVPEFLEDRGYDFEVELDEELYEQGEQWLTQATPQQRESFTEWLLNYLPKNMPYEASEVNLD